MPAKTIMPDGGFEVTFKAAVSYFFYKISEGAISMPFFTHGNGGAGIGGPYVSEVAVLCLGGTVAIL